MRDVPPPMSPLTPSPHTSPKLGSCIPSLSNDESLSQASGGQYDHTLGELFMKRRASILPHGGYSAGPDQVEATVLPKVASRRASMSPEMDMNLWPATG